MQAKKYDNKKTFMEYLSLYLYVLWEEEAHCIAHNVFLCVEKFSIFLNEIT